MIDVAAVMTLKRETPYPVLVDCSSVSRDLWYAERIATAAITAGADGILLDVASATDKKGQDSGTVTTDELGDLVRKGKALKFTLDAMRLSTSGS
jgi:3-deoxy-D-arabino-heptulosonate 7-phosphate (DAHP) synthase